MIVHDDLVKTTSGALARLTNATSLIWGTCVNAKRSCDCKFVGRSRGLSLERKQSIVSKAISRELHVAWRGCGNLVKTDKASASIVQATIDRHRCTVVIIPHPMAWPNRKGYNVRRDRILKLRAAFDRAAARVRLPRRRPDI